MISFNHLSELASDIDAAVNLLAEIQDCTTKKDMIIIIKKVRGRVNEMERKIGLPGTAYIEEAKE